MTLRQWVEERFPVADLVSSSEPEPILLQHNAVAVSRNPEVARSVVLAWERTLAPDGAVGFLALGTRPQRRGDGDAEVEPGADGVMGHAAGRIWRGGIPGALAGAIVVSAVVLVVMGWTPVLIGAALGGAVFGFIVGSMLSFTKGTGWGSAYIDSFVDDDQTELLVASIHADDDSQISAAVDAVADVDEIELYFVDRTGATSRVG